MREATKNWTSKESEMHRDMAAQKDALRAKEKELGAQCEKGVGTLKSELNKMDWQRDGMEKELLRRKEEQKAMRKAHQDAVTRENELRRRMHQLSDSLEKMESRLKAASDSQRASTQELRGGPEATAECARGLATGPRGRGPRI